MKHKTILKGYEFLNIRKIADLASILGAESGFLKILALNPEYTTFEITKKSGGFRKIEAPSAVLKRVQKKLNYYLQSAYCIFRPEFVHGFIPKTENKTDTIGIISNARAHVAKPHIMTIDLEDYFHSFTAIKVWNLFRADPFNFPEPLANILTMLTTWYDILPMGSPVSPVLSNFLTNDLDDELSAFTKEHKGTYTRYADDLTFSFDTWITEEIIQKIRLIIEKKGFRINSRKFRIQSGNKRQMVTGLVVNRKVNINRQYIRQLRAILFDCRKNGIENAARRFFKLDNYPNSIALYRFKRSLQGRIQFIGSVRGKNDQIYEHFIQKYNSVFLKHD
jgi:RNA-directed DNA polymerase